MTERRTTFAIGSFVLAAVLTAIGSYIEDHELIEWLVVLAISAVAAGIVFWVVYPRVQHFGRTALILAVIGAGTTGFLDRSAKHLRGRRRRTVEDDAAVDDESPHSPLVTWLLEWPPSPRVHTASAAGGGVVLASCE